MKTRKPAWWQLYLLVPTIFVLIAIEGLEPLPGISNNLADAGIVVLFFVVVLWWVHLNGGLLERYYLQQDGNYNLQVTVYPPTAKPNDNGNNSHDLTPLAMPRSDLHLRDWQKVGLEEKEKWSRN
jgi:hypothetical protein